MSKDRLNNAYQKYLDSFDYGQGTVARKKGGYMGFGKTFDGGGFQDDIYDTGDFGWTGEYVDALRAKLHGAGKWLGDNAKTIGAVGTGVISAVNQADLTKDLDSYKKELNATNPSATGVLDNDAVMNWFNTNPYVSDTALGAGLSAGAMTANPWIGAGVAAANVVGSIIGRARAKSASDKANKLNAEKNKRIDTGLFHAGMQADANNDFLRMLGYYNDPYEYALGGEMRSHGSDWNNGLTFIDAGGRHESNPYEGVPSGVDDEGVPNLVEEGEVIWNNEYVFSDRIKVPKALRDKYKLKEGLTFAEAITEVTKESQSRPNDPISNETNRAIVNEFMEIQEGIREEKQQRAAAELQSALDEDFMNQLAMYSQSQAQSPKAPVDLGVAQQVPQEGMPIEGEPAGFAFGGNKFAIGGPEENGLIQISTDSNGNTVYVLPNGVSVGSYREAQARLANMNMEELNFALDKSRPYSSYSTVPAAVFTGTRSVPKATTTDTTSTKASPAPIDSTSIKITPVITGYNTKGQPIYGYAVTGYKQAFSTLEDAQKYADKQRVKLAVMSRDTGYGKGYLLSNGEVVMTEKEAVDRQKEINKRSNQTAKSTTQNSSSQPTVAQDSSSRATIPTDTTRATIPASTDTTSRTAVPAQRSTYAATSTGSGAPAATPTRSTRATTGTVVGSNGTIDYDRSINGKAFESQQYYRDFIDFMDNNADSDAAKKWISYINDEIKKQGDNYVINSFEDWKRLATDEKVGPVHKATFAAAQNFAKRQSAPRLESLTKIDSPRVTVPEETLGNPLNLATANDAGKNTTALNGATNNPSYERLFNGLRTAPIWGSGIMALNSIIEGPNYYNADRMIEAANRMGTPINIPVQTIGDYMTYKPYDERYLVNMANQNRAAATRGIANTSAGNRAMDLLGNMSLAYNSQQNLGEIMRQAYLANQTERARVADFNRATNIQNMNAINQRNLSQAQLNSQRQSQSMYGLMQGYQTRQNIWSDWRNDRDANITTFLDNLGSYGREGVTDNQALSFLKELGTNWTFDPNSGAISFVPKAKGGRKRRRF